MIYPFLEKKICIQNAHLCQYTVLNTAFSDIQCFTVQPVLEIPPRLMNKPVPDQIIKLVYNNHNVVP